MIRKAFFLAMAGSFLLATASLALCADIVGTVSDAQGNPVQDIQILIKNAGGKILGKVTTDSHGRYQISGLTPGAYNYVLEPRGTSFKGGTAASHLDPKGLTIYWKVSASNPASALATAGTADSVVAGDPFEALANDPPRRRRRHGHSPSE
jgi:carboxypeptidase family protein